MPRGIPLDSEQLDQIKVGKALGKTNTSIARNLGVTEEGLRRTAIRLSSEIAKPRAQKDEQLAALCEVKVIAGRRPLLVKSRSEHCQRVYACSRFLG